MGYNAKLAITGDGTSTNNRGVRIDSGSTNIEIAGLELEGSLGALAGTLDAYYGAPGEYQMGVALYAARDGPTEPRV